MDINSEKIAKLGSFMKGLLAMFITDRYARENQWLKNLRQYAGEYDKDVLGLIPAERSHVYPRDTKIKIKGGVAKMMEMMFPSLEKNWELGVSPNPSIPQDSLQQILDALQTQQAQTGEPVTSETIERAVRAFAEKRKDKMETEIADQLADPGVDYPQLCKRVVRSGYLYGFGVARSPLVRTQKERIWEADEATGAAA